MLDVTSPFSAIRQASRCSRTHGRWNRSVRSATNSDPVAILRRRCSRVVVGGPEARCRRSPRRREGAPASRLTTHSEGKRQSKPSTIKDPCHIIHGGTGRSVMAAFEAETAGRFQRQASAFFTTFMHRERIRSARSTRSAAAGSASLTCQHRSSTAECLLSHVDLVIGVASLGVCGYNDAARPENRSWLRPIAVTAEVMMMYREQRATMCVQIIISCCLPAMSIRSSAINCGRPRAATPMRGWLLDARHGDQLETCHRGRQHPPADEI